ncbi:hypothetical protein Ait01nite_046420 [Actinoplanes italicus]|uniref:Uncharacterized protein n=1 Tax=Actinoplanes italicus TaxID=113567 RepID=A0A2T0K9D6_9ACTN|nr:hypothetical protein [Actinoplanes italicus]PRX19748.1 hypothetical protein CLV67_10913 [Actinoplanes italicus]GIE31597.1 hypothetical protein Ait01nite_046420 [Actinoplanes italicus]
MPGLQPADGVLSSEHTTAHDNGWEEPMNATIDDIRCEALFASDLQRSWKPTPELIRAAVTDVVGRIGETGCAEMVAQEFGEHPDCAIGRMLWARDAIRLAFAA